MHSCKRKKFLICFLNLSGVFFAFHLTAKSAAIFLFERDKMYVCHDMMLKCGYFIGIMNEHAW